MGEGYVFEYDFNYFDNKDSNNTTKMDCILRENKGIYYLNLLIDEFWTPLMIVAGDEKYDIRFTRLNEDKYESRVTYYNSMYNISKSENNKYIANIADDKLVNLMNEKDLSDIEIWEKVSDNNHISNKSSSFILPFLLFGTLILLIFLFRNRNKKSIE